MRVQHTVPVLDARRPRGGTSEKDNPIDARVLRVYEALPRPRLLACEIDGTLVDPHGVLRDAVRDAVALVAASGVEVVLVTGRSPQSGVTELTARLGLPGPNITMQGGLISVPATGTFHRVRALPPRLYLDALRFADECGLDPIVALLDGHRAERLADGIDFLAVPQAERSRFRYATDLARLVDEGPIRVFLPTGSARHRPIRLAAQECFAGRGSVVWSDLTGIEILAPGIHKGEALAWLAAARGIGLGEVAAVGDAQNDVAMLLIAGRSAAMGGAPAEMRLAADIVVPTSDDDGVLDAFEWFFPDLRLRPWAPCDRGRVVRLPS